MTFLIKVFKKLLEIAFDFLKRKTTFVSIIEILS